MTDWRHSRTDRLRLDLPVDDDVADLHAIHADPAVWTHFPSGRHTDPAQSEAMIRQSERQFATDGLGYWSVREAGGGPVIGRGGCAVRPGKPWWNLYYRLAPAVQGRGLATELARAGIEAAHAVDPERPVMAFLLEHNIGSQRTAERVGLRLVWRGPDRPNPDPDAIRLVYLDREPSRELAELIDTSFRAGE